LLLLLLLLLLQRTERFNVPQLFLTIQ